MRQVKTVYCIVVISVALILASVGGLLGIITAIIVLLGALPMFQAIEQVITRSIGEETETTHIYVSTLYEERRHRQALRVNDARTPPTHHTAEDQI